MDQLIIFNSKLYKPEGCENYYVGLMEKLRKMYDNRKSNFMWQKFKAKIKIKNLYLLISEKH